MEPSPSGADDPGVSSPARTGPEVREDPAPRRVPTSRRSDRGPALLARLLRGRSHEPAVVLGQLLLLACGTVFTLTAPLLAPGPRAWPTVAGVSALLLAALVVSLRLRWGALPRWAPLSMPVLVWAAMAVLGLREGMAQPYPGFWVLAFTVTGLTQSARTNTVLLVPAAVAYVLAIGSSDAVFVVRALIAGSVWVLTSQLLVSMTGHQRRLASAMHDAAHTDALTGVANRRDLDARLAALREGDTVVICDLDHFKDLNDRWGHAAGDRVLADFGTLLRTGLREGDHAARYGGEEFALLLPATTATQACAVTDRLRERWSLLQPGTTFSAGAATLAAGATTAEVVTAADRALYAAKADGRDRTRTAETSRAGAATR